MHMKVRYKVTYKKTFKCDTKGRYTADIKERQLAKCKDAMQATLCKDVMR